MAEVVDPAQALPIDIAYIKLADWLVDRRKVPPDWRKKVATVHAKVSAALSTLPRSVDTSFGSLTPDCTGYLEAKHVRDVLLARPESRNLFGRPTGAAAEWDAIVSAYEKDLIYLGEAAQIMVQSTNYDMPYQKKQIAKFQQQLADLERKEAELKRNAVQSASKYQQACQELGIPGINVRAELLALGKTLPNIFADVVEGLCGGVIGSALEYYQAFSSYAHAIQGDESTPVLSTMNDLRVNPPDVHAELSLTSSETRPDHQPDTQVDTQVEVNDRGIDWGVGTEDVDASMPIDIDWNIGTLDEIDVQDDNALSSESQNTDKGDSYERNESAAVPDDGPGQDIQSSEISWDVDLPAEINWDIDVEEAGVLSTPEFPQIVDQQTSNEGPHPVKVGDGQDAPSSWFSKTENRNRLLDDLFELKVFLKQRLQEIDSDETSALQNQVQVVAPSSIPQHGSEALLAMASSVTKAFNLFTNRATRELILICTSMRYLDRLEASLIHKKQNEVNLQKNIADLSSKRLELRNLQAALWPKQEATIERTLAVKRHVESVLSTQYNGRKVNIIGEINTLLGQT
ncbi:unnamed protein product [Calypogeia fissa]